MIDESWTPNLIDRKGSDRPGRRSWLVMLAATVSSAVLLAFAIPFAAVQSLWSDETTQVAGLSVGPLEATRWLMGEDPDRFGVPPDRMPPLSYWSGWAWSHTFGHGEAPQRSLGLAATALACAGVAVAAGRLAGPSGAIIAGLLFALSPNVVTVAPEIRAYPLFLAFASLVFLALAGYIQADHKRASRWLLVLLIASLAATYTHFYGLVLGGAAISSAALISLMRRRHVVGPIAAGLALLASSAGLAPFVSYSTQLSKGSGHVRTDPSFLRLIYRLVGHPAASVDPIALGLLLLGFGGLVILAILPRRSGERECERSRANAGTHIAGPEIGPRLDLLAVPIALLLGLGVTFLVGLKVSGFEVYKPSYSLWAVPGLCIVTGSAVAPRLGRRMRLVAVVCVSMALLGSIWSEVVIMRHRTSFGHGPHRAIVSLIESARGGRPPIIVHEREGPWAFIYFPLRLVYGPELEQYLMPGDRDGQLESLLMEPLAGATHPVALRDLPRERWVLVVRASTMGQSELRRELRGGGEPVPTGPVMDHLERQLGWPMAGSLRHFAFTAAQARLFAPRTDGVSADAPTPIMPRELGPAMSK
jgi:4-amino-4-deoxy-L-arabinose transferase-like glycosyltransferase